MNLPKEKQWIKTTIDSINDEIVIAAVKNIVHYAQTAKYMITPMSVEELQNRAIESENAITAGLFTDIENVKKEMQQW